MATHLVTGAGSGIGAGRRRAAARPRRRAGAAGAVATSGPHELAERFPGAPTLVADLADPEAVESARALPDALDSVRARRRRRRARRRSPSSTPTTWREQLDVNLVAPAAADPGRAAGAARARGTVVFVNSGAGLLRRTRVVGVRRLQAGLRALADALRAEEAGARRPGHHGLPGRTATPMQEKVHEQEGKEYDAAAWIQPETVAARSCTCSTCPRDATIPEVTVRPLVPWTPR